MKAFARVSVATLGGLAAAAPAIAEETPSMGLEVVVVTAQKRQPRVQVWPSTMIVAVPALQHSPTFGQRASSHTVFRSRLRSVCLMRV